MVVNVHPNRVRIKNLGFLFGRDRLQKMHLCIREKGRVQNIELHDLGQTISKNQGLLRRPKYPAYSKAYMIVVLCSVS